MSGYFYHDEVYVLRPGTKTNRAQETVLDYSGLQDAPGYPRAHVQVRPVQQSELPAEDRNAAVEVWDLATEPGSGDWDVRATDWLRLPDGSIVAVSGPPARPTDPISGALHHVEVRCRQVIG